jgi:RNA polymerase sigma factor (sigma-70 family)
MAKNNYFNNDEVEKAIKEYRKAVKKNPDSTENIEILYPYTDQFQKLVRGVINVHKIYRFHNDLDELCQEGIMALYASFDRFDPSKGTAFNYFSITVKNHLKNWTQTKNKKEWATQEFNEVIYDNHDMSDNSFSIYTLQERIANVDIPEDLFDLMERIIEIIFNDKVYHKRDAVKFLLREGWDREDIDKIYAALEKEFETKDE